jgi:hypothetical protein
MLLAASLVVLMVSVASLGASAAVTITDFKASPRPDGSIQVSWHTESEEEITAFRIYRGQAQDQLGELLQDSLISATGLLTGNDYKYMDSRTTPGSTYYYTLEEIRSDGTLAKFPDKAVATASVLATSTSTITPTPTPSLTRTPSRTPSRTPTRYPTYSYIATALPTLRPTATRRFTVTPLPPPTALPTATRLPTQPQPVQRAIATPAPGRVTTPTGRAMYPVATATQPLLPLVTPSPTPEQPAPGELTSGTEAALVQLLPSATFSPTASPVVTPTPQKVARLLLSTPDMRPTPQPAPTSTEDSGGNTRWLVAAGSGALGLALFAAISTAVVWYVRKPR